MLYFNDWHNNSQEIRGIFDLNCSSEHEVTAKNTVRFIGTNKIRSAKHVFFFIDGQFKKIE